ncbi:MAG: glycosyltransferase [Acidobacteriota bacterium]
MASRPASAGASVAPADAASPAPAERQTQHQTYRLANRRVALVHDWLTGMRGGEKVLEAIAEHFPGAPIYTLLHIPGSVSAKLESHPIRTSYLQRAPGIRRYYRHYLPLFPSAIEDFDFSSFDLILSTSHCVAKGVIPPPHAFHICYCHTPMRYVWDQEHTYFPRRRGLIARLRQLAISRLRSWDVASTPRVDLFLANSSFVARRIERYYSRSAEVVPPPVDVDFFSQESERDDGGSEKQGYCLIVTALAPYKRLELAIEACQRLGRELRIVGSGPEHQRLQRLAGPTTRLLGRIDGEELRRLFQNAEVFLQPGIEDFGIAPVEALACGTPVVALGRGGVLDIVEDGVHGVLYRTPPGASAEDEIAALSAAIDKSRQISFNKLKLRVRASDFSRQRFVERYVSHVPQLSKDA